MSFVVVSQVGLEYPPCVRFVVGLGCVSFVVGLGCVSFAAVLQVWLDYPPCVSFVMGLGYPHSAPKQTNCVSCVSFVVVLQVGLGCPPCVRGTLVQVRLACACVALNPQKSAWALLHAFSTSTTW